MQVTLNANRPAQDDLGMTRSIRRRQVNNAVDCTGFANRYIAYANDMPLTCPVRRLGCNFIKLCNN